jgi:hypothetical protein
LPTPHGAARAKFKSLLGLFASLSIGAANAGSGWTDASQVHELRTSIQHYYTVRLDVKENPSGCRDKQWFFQDYVASGSDKMFLTLLEAIKAGIRVRVYVTGRCNLAGYSEFSSVSVAR